VRSWALGSMKDTGHCFMKLIFPLCRRHDMLLPQLLAVYQADTDARQKMNSGVLQKSTQIPLLPVGTHATVWFSKLSDPIWIFSHKRIYLKMHAMEIYSILAYSFYVATSIKTLLEWCFWHELICFCQIENMETNV
jgi:hypothetical protein